MRDVPVEKVRECQTSFLDKLRTAHKDVVDVLSSGAINDDVCHTLENVMADIAGQYKG